jgi:hypothetical protein
MSGFRDVPTFKVFCADAKSREIVVLNFITVFVKRCGRPDRVAR